MIDRIGPFVQAVASATLLMSLQASPLLADYTVAGKVLYKKRAYGANGFTGAVFTRPIRYADVRIVDSADKILASGMSDADGSFSISVPGSAAQAIRVRCMTAAHASAPFKAEIRYANSDLSFGGIQSLTSVPYNASGSGTLDAGEITAEATTDIGRAFNIYDAVCDGMEFLASPQVNGSFPTDTLTVLWTSWHATTASFYSSTPSRFIFIGSKSAQDDPVIFHQLGHYALDVFSRLDAPLTGSTFGDPRQDIRAAWAEGAGMFIGAAIRQFKGYARPDAYFISDGTNALLSLEIESLASTYPLQSIRGSTNMLAVCAALWDIVDGSATPDGSPGTDDDGLSRGFGDIWRVMTQYMVTLTTPGRSVEDFWDGWFALGNGSDSEMRNIFSALNGIEFVEDLEEADNSVSSAAPIVPARFEPAAGAVVVINEIDPGAVASIELFNAGDTEVDLSGWSVTAYRSGYPSAFLELPALRLKPGGFVVLSEAAGVNTGRTLYFGTPIPWAPGAEGACALRDRTGAGRDFVRWGDSREFPPGGTNFTGQNPPSPPVRKTLGRDLTGRDTDASGDWSIQDPTPGMFNPGGSGQHRTFYPAGDEDYAAFDAVAGLCYLIETLNLASGADTVLTLLGGDGTTVLASSDDYGPTSASKIVWTAPASGKYTIRVRLYTGPRQFARYGSYDLRVIESTMALPPALPETLTVSKPGHGGRYGSVSEAVEAAANGDTVQIIDSGTYTENVVLTGKSITIRVAAGKQPVLDGRGRNVNATIEIRNLKQATIDGLTVLGGRRGVYVSGAAGNLYNMVVHRADDPSGYSDGIQIVGRDTFVDVVHCTVVYNKRVGIGVFIQASARVINSVAFGNSTDIGGDGTATSLVVRNCTAPKSNYVGKDNNIGDDPKFVNATAYDYRLQLGSPAIDKGDPGDANLPPADAMGLPRSLDGNGDGSAVPDMGAFEYMTDGSLTVGAVFPQIAVGGPAGAEYRTSVVVVNTGTQAAAVKASLTRSDGSPMPVTASGTTASTFSFVLASSGTSRLETTSSSGETQAGYALILSNTGVSGTALFKWMSGEEVRSEAGVGLSKPTRRFIVYIDNLDNAFSGYAVANSGTLPADLSMVLRDKDGRQVATKNLVLEAGRHIAKFAVEADQFGPAAGAGFEGSIEFTSDRNVAAVALRYDNETDQVFSTIPVLVDEAATILYFPQVADGGGYRTNFILVNPGNSPATARLEFYADDGAPLSLPVAGQSRSTMEVQLAANGVTHLFTDGTSQGVKVGWVKVVSSLPIGGSGIFQVTAGNRIVSEAGVSSSPLASRFVTYVESLGRADSGVAVCNPGSSAVTVTLNLRDTAGNIAASTSFSLPPNGHIARFFSGPYQWFPSGFDEFEGTLEVISSGGQVSGVALRYDNERARVFATLPVIVVQ